MLFTRPSSTTSFKTKRGDKLNFEMIWARLGLFPRVSPTNLFRFWAPSNPFIKQLLAHQKLYRLDTHIPIAWNCLWSVMPLLDHWGPNLLFFFFGKTTWWLQGLGIYKPSRDKNRVRDILVFSVLPTWTNAYRADGLHCRAKKNSLHIVLPWKIRKQKQNPSEKNHEDFILLEGS